MCVSECMCEGEKESKQCLHLHGDSRRIHGREEVVEGSHGICSVQDKRESAHCVQQSSQNLAGHLQSSALTTTYIYYTLTCMDLTRCQWLEEWLKQSSTCVRRESTREWSTTRSNILSTTSRWVSSSAPSRLGRTNKLRTNGCSAGMAKVSTEWPEAITPSHFCITCRRETLH